MSKTWKKVELEIAKFLGGTRVPITGRARGSEPDVAHPLYSIEVKHKNRNSFPDWLLNFLKDKNAVILNNKYKIFLLKNYENNLNSSKECSNVERSIPAWLLDAIDQAMASRKTAEQVPVVILHKKYSNIKDSVVIQVLDEDIIKNPLTYSFFS